MNMEKRLYYYLNVVTAICLCAVFLMAQSGGIITKDQKAKEAVDAAIKAIGGADKIGNIKSLIIKGTTILSFIDGFVLPNGMTPKSPPPEEFEIRILLPDSFLKITTNSNNIQLYRGVSQGILIPPIMAGRLAPDSKSSQEAPITGDVAIIVNHQTNIKIDEWLHFLVGMLMKTGASPVTISSGSTSGVFTLTKKDGSLGEIEFDSKTCYPSAIRYKKPEMPPLPGGSILVGGDLRGGSSSVASGLKKPDHDEIRFQDRFSVNGIMLPRIITTFDAETMFTTELRIREALINPELSLKDFGLPNSKMSPR